MIRRRAGLGLALAALLAGCGGLGSSAPRRYFVLEAAPTGLAPGPLRHDAVLLVAPTTAGSFYDSQDIVYSRRLGERAFYQLSSWTEPPHRSVASLLKARLAWGGAFRAVAESGSGVRGSLLLRTHLIELYHDAVDSPGAVRLVLRAELSDVAGRSLLGQRNFEATVPAPSYDAVGAVQAAGRGLGQLLDEVAAWTARTAAGAGA